MYLKGGPSENQKELQFTAYSPNAHNSKGRARLKAMSLELRLSLLHEWQRPKHLGHPLPSCVN